MIPRRFTQDLVIFCRTRSLFLDLLIFKIVNQREGDSSSSTGKKKFWNQEIN